MDKRILRGQILKELREKRGLKQEELAAFLGITQQAYGRYEKGTSEPNGDGFVKLADFYGVTTDYLLGRESKIDPITMLNLDIPEGNAVERFVQLPSEVRKVVLDVMIKLADAARETNDNPPAEEPEASEQEQETIPTYIAARSDDDHPPEVIETTTDFSKFPPTNLKL